MEAFAGILAWCAVSIGIVWAISLAFILSVYRADNKDQEKNDNKSL